MVPVRLIPLSPVVPEVLPKPTITPGVLCGGDCVVLSFIGTMRVTRVARVSTAMSLDVAKSYGGQERLTAYQCATALRRQSTPLQASDRWFQARGNTIDDPRRFKRRYRSRKKDKSGEEGD